MQNLKSDKHLCIIYKPPVLYNVKNFKNYTALLNIHDGISFQQKGAPAAFECYVNVIILMQNSSKHRSQKREKNNIADGMRGYEIELHLLFGLLSSWSCR